MKYLPPLQCFLIVNVLFFLWSATTERHILDTELRQHVNTGIYGRQAARLLAQKIAEQHGDSVLVAHQFATVTGVQAKSLVLVMVPLFALGIAALTIGGKKHYTVHHVVFSLHFYAYLLVLFMVVVYVFIGLAHVLPRPWALRLLGPDDSDDTLSIALLAGIAIYLWFALRRVYDLGPFRATLTATASAFLAFIVFVVYRALLSFITMASI